MDIEAKAIFKAIDESNYEYLFKFSGMKGKYNPGDFYDAKYLIYNRILDYIIYDIADEEATDELVKRIKKKECNIPLKLTDIIERKDQNYAEHCIEKRDELGIDAYDIMCILRNAEDIEHADKWLVKRDELKLNNVQVVEIITSMDDDNYVDQCIERREQLKLTDADIVLLINSVSRIDIVDKWIRRRDELGLSSEDVLDMILGLNSFKFTDSCIKDRGKLGLDVNQIVDLIIGIGGKKYIRGYIDKSEELGLEPIDVTKLILNIPLMTYDEKLEIIKNNDNKLDSRAITLLLETWQLNTQAPKEFKYIEEYIKTR